MYYVVPPDICIPLFPKIKQVKTIKQKLALAAIIVFLCFLCTVRNRHLQLSDQSYILFLKLRTIFYKELKTFRVQFWAYIPIYTFKMIIFFKVLNSLTFFLFFIFLSYMIHYLLPIYNFVFM